MTNSEIRGDTVKVKEKPERARPQIVENYRDFASPPWLKAIIEKALDSVPPNYLAGLKTVVLTNKSSG